MWETNDISRVPGGVEDRGEGGRTNRIGKEFYSFENPFHLKQGRKWLVSGMSQKNTEMYLV